LSTKIAAFPQNISGYVNVQTAAVVQLEGLHKTGVASSSGGETGGGEEANAIHIPQSWGDYIQVVCN